MATPQEHCTKAAAHEHVARNLDLGSQIDWKVVAWFYADLHLVEARLRENGQASTTHHSRITAMRNVNMLRSVVPDYETLQGYANMARYDAGVKISPQDAQRMCDLAADIKRQLGY